MFRRSFVKSFVGVIFALTTAVGAPEPLRFAYVGSTDSTAWKGVKQGLDEANILGRFSGHTYTLERVEPEDLKRLPAQKMPLAILAATDADTLVSLSDALAEVGVAVFNLTAEDDSLRLECRHNLLHTSPSFRMKADAVAQWRKKSDSPNILALAWHSDFKKFAGRELNNRFRKAQGIPMDDIAWTGWAAVKMVSQAVAESQSTNPRALLTYLRQEMEFDGQKGQPLTFRDNGQLRQPLLIVDEGKLVAEAPVPGVVDPEDLDSLGLASCQ